MEVKNHQFVEENRRPKGHAIQVTMMISLSISGANGVFQEAPNGLTVHRDRLGNYDHMDPPSHGVKEQVSLTFLRPQNEKKQIPALSPIQLPSSSRRSPPVARTQYGFGGPSPPATLVARPVRASVACGTRRSP